VVRICACSITVPFAATQEPPPERFRAPLSTPGWSCAAHRSHSSANPGDVRAPDELRGASPASTIARLRRAR
jgi:hypothetical protein